MQDLEPTPLALWNFWGDLMKDRPELIPSEFTLRWHKRLEDFNRLCGSYDPFRIIEETVKSWSYFIKQDGIWPRPDAPDLETIVNRYDFAIAYHRQFGKERNASMLRPKWRRLIAEHNLLDLKPSKTPLTWPQLQQAKPE